MIRFSHIFVNYFSIYSSILIDKLFSYVSMVPKSFCCPFIIT